MSVEIPGGSITKNVNEENESENFFLFFIDQITHGEFLQGIFR